MELAEIEIERDELRAKLAQAKADLKHAQKMNKELSTNDKRYRQLKAWLIQCGCFIETSHEESEPWASLEGPFFMGETFDEAVDTLPDAKEGE